MKSITIIVLIFTFSLQLVAQETTDENTANDLNSQYEELKEDAESFKQFKLLDQTQLDAFWKTTMDSLNQLKQKNASLIDENRAKEESISSLNAEISEKQDQIEKLENQTSTIEVFGADLQKSTFIFISFFTIGSLILVLGFVLYKYQDNNKVAQTKVNDYNKLNDEFEEYKRSSLEKQMKLRRDLQTERNKLEEARN